MQQPRIPITREGLEKLNEEFDDLVNRRRPEIVRAIAQAREEGDLRENAGYDAAKNDHHATHVSPSHHVRFPPPRA